MRWGTYVIFALVLELTTKIIIIKAKQTNIHITANALLTPDEVIESLYPLNW